MSGPRKPRSQTPNFGYDPYNGYPPYYPPPNPYPSNLTPGRYPPYSPRFGSAPGAPPRLFQRPPTISQPLSPVHTTVQVGLPVTNDDLRLHVNELLREVAHLKAENSNFRVELDYMHSLFNGQATHVAQVEADLDNLAQYNRRENVVFTNLLIDEQHTVTDQVVNLCQEIGVDVEANDIVAAHALPTSRHSKVKKYIARFHQRSKAQQVFQKRKYCKEIPREKKKSLAANPDKGFSIAPNLTPKRAKLLGQVKEFNSKYSHAGCWVDYNSSKIMLKLKDGQRGTVIKDTSDLVMLNQNYCPDQWVFCAPPFFECEQAQKSPDIKDIVYDFSPNKSEIESTKPN